MNAYDFVHLAFLAFGKEVQGKTMLQKLVYFLGVLTGSLEELGYRAHYYGPYSDEVSDAVQRLVALRFVDVNTVGGGAVNDLGFEVARYDYRLNEPGRSIAKLKAQRHPEMMKRLEREAKKLEQATCMGYMKLSVAAKTHFMLGKKNRATMSDMVQLAKKFGWNVTENEVREAGEFLAELGLVEVVADPQR